MKKSRLLVISTSYPLHEDSVSGIFVRRLNRALNKYFEISVLCPDSADSVEQVNEEVLRVRYAPRKFQLLAHRQGGIPVAIRENKLLILLVPFLLLLMFIGIGRHIRSFDSVVAHWSVSGALAGLWCRIFSKPLICVMHGSDAHSIRSSFVNRIFASITLRFSDRVIGVSEAICLSLRTEFPQFADKIEFVPNGIDSTLLSLNRPKLDAPVIVTVANLNPKKGVQDLIEAFARLPMRDSTPLVVIGDGPQRTALTQLAEQRGVSSQVRFMGTVPPHEIQNHLMKANIFVLASYSEGRPSVILEAMATGMAIITTRLPGIQELVSENINGCLFDPGDVESLAAHLTRLINAENTICELGRAARETISAGNLTWENSACQYQKMIGELLSLRRVNEIC